ncbi:hypothetical protein L1887_17095 [Cichorium endivia]|nr:hypothetical protein L1887_17095 [Cichorium endivia]
MGFAVTTNSKLKKEKKSYLQQCSPITYIFLDFDFEVGNQVHSAREVHKMALGFVRTVQFVRVRRAS